MKVDYGYHYKKWHSDTPEHADALSAYYHRILSPHLPTDRNARLLDIGCGMGFTLLALKKMGFQKVEGIDSDEGQAASCQAKGLAVSLCSDAAKFLRDNANGFDVILAFDLLEHIPVSGQLEFVAAIGTALRSGGIVICTTPNANSSLAGRYRYLDWTHQTAFTEASLDFLLHHGGFQNIRIAEVEYFERPEFWWLPFGAGKHWWAFRFFRFWRRLEMMAELGSQGRTVPLSLNLLGTAAKP